MFLKRGCSISLQPLFVLVPFRRGNKPPVLRGRNMIGAIIRRASIKQAQKKGLPRLACPMGKREGDRRRRWRDLYSVA